MGWWEARAEPWRLAHVYLTLRRRHRFAVNLPIASRALLIDVFREGLAAMASVEKQTFLREYTRALRDSSAALFVGEAMFGQRVSHSVD